MHSRLKITQDTYLQVTLKSSYHEETHFPSSSEIKLSEIKTSSTVERKTFIEIKLQKHPILASVIVY